MVFSTATQPTFQAVTDWNPTEILPGHARLFDQLHRTMVTWRLDEKTPLADIAREMLQQRNACAIVNLRDHARVLFRLFREACGSNEGLFFLTPDPCPAHRIHVVEDIRARKSSGLPCLVVATQCIEAGIDLDFDAMYRALAPWRALCRPPVAATATAADPFPEKWWCSSPTRRVGCTPTAGMSMLP